jgi:alkylation response protein AidB-like acyl-CoA dehydrogenase
MDLVLTEEQELLRSTARELVSGRSSLRRIRQLRDDADADGFSRALWKEMAELGWLGITVPVEHGGLGLGAMDLACVMEEVGRGLMPEPLLSTVVLGAGALLLGGSAAQQAAHLPAIAAGERLFALAAYEARGRHDPYHTETRAEQVSGGWILRGEKTPVLDGHVADWLVVSARTAGDVADPSGVGLFLVAPGAPGLHVSRLTRVDGRNAAVVRLDGVRVAADGVLGAPGAGGPVLARVIDRGTAALAAEMLGGMEAAFEMTLAYLKTRQQFGVPIGSFQALKHRAAKMFVELELARSAVMHAARTIDEGRDDRVVARAVSVAKARVSDAFVLVGNEGVQMHGGIGMTDEHDIGFFLKRARVAEMTFGDASWHRERFAALEGY